MNKSIFILLLFLGIFVACEQPTACTLDLRTITLEVTGGALSQTYTIRTATGDTVQRAELDLSPDLYSVLDDTYQDDLQGVEADFLFVGLMGDSVVVEETYRIGADACHIYKISGPVSISL